MNPSILSDPPKSAPPERPMLREAKFEDYEEIAALQSRTTLATRSRPEWSALWTGNPAFENLPEPFPIGWVLESADHGIVGYLGNLPLAYRFRGRELSAATAFSWAVDAPYRRYSMRLLDRFLSQSHVQLFVFATTNAAAEPVYRALQFSRAPVGTWDKSAFWIIGHREFARAALQSTSARIPQWCVAPFTAALSLRARSTRRHNPKTAVHFEFCSGFDARFDHFWEQLQRESHGRLLAVRNRATLEWHFRQPLRRQTWILTSCEGGRLVAYSIFDRWDLDRLDLKRLRFVDFQCLAGFEDLIGPSIDWMLRLCRREGIHSAENVGCWLESGGANRVAAPYRRKMKSWIFYYKARDKELALALANPDVWRPTSYDGDASL